MTNANATFELGGVAAGRWRHM